MIELPKKFLQNMQTQLTKDEFALFLKEYEKPFLKAIRFNCNKNIDEKLLDLLNLKKENKLPFANAYLIDNTTKLGNHPLHHAGVFYVQEASAMLPVNCVEYSKDDIVLDMCASPGGKSSQIAERIPNGVLVSNEIITNRAIVLKENITRLGFKNTIITSTTPENLLKLGAIFDKILVDAPCSGEGLFRREEKSIQEWYDGINEKNAERQLDILDKASKLCACGGKIIYSTCTFSKTENEDVCKKFLQTHKDYSLCDACDIVKQNTCLGYEGYGYRVYPFNNIGEGQFMVVFKNNMQTEKEYNKQKGNLRKLTVKEEQIFKKWVNTYLTEFNYIVKAHDENIFALPNKEINTSGIFTLQYGVNLGKIVKDRFEVNHNFFTAFGELFKTSLDLSLDDERIKKYLLGESFEESDLIDGYACVKVCSYPIGGVKITQNRANNLYPKHLRVKDCNFNF